MQRTPVRGRDTELAELGVILKTGQGGADAVVLIEGGAGMGKSRLLDEAGEVARRLTFRCGMGRADPDAGVELALVLDALFGRSAPLPSAALRRLPAAADERYWLLQEIQALLEQAAMQRPVLVALDDFQWADTGTLAAVRALVAGLRGLPIVWVIAFRPVRDGSPPGQAVSMLQRSGARRFLLGPLDDRSQLQVCRDITGAEPSNALRELLRSAEGNPFLLTELLGGLLDEERVERHDGKAHVSETRMPARLNFTTRDRLGILSASARESAVVAASLGRTFSFTQLAKILDRPPAGLLTPVQELIENGILVERDGDLGFHHDITRDAVRVSLPASARRALDRQAVRVLLATGADPVEVAAQLASSADVGDRSAVETLHEAIGALAATDPSSGADLAGRALELTSDDDPRRPDLIIQMALSLHAAGRFAEGWTVVETCLHDVLAPEDQARVLLTIAGMFALPPDRRSEAGLRALALEGVSPAIRAQHRCALFHTFVISGRLAEAREARDAARAALQHSPDDSAEFTLTLSEAQLAFIDLDFTRFADLAERAARSPAARREPTRQRLSQVIRSEALMHTEQVEASLAITNHELARADSERQAWALRLLEIWRGRQLLHLGRLDDAAAVLDGQFNLDDQNHFAGLPETVGLIALGRVALHRGDERQSERTAALARAIVEEGPPGFRRHAAWLLALQAIARGDPAEAHRWVCAGDGDDRLSLLPLFPADVTDEAHLVRLAQLVGDDELARATVELAQRRAQLNGSVPAVLGIAAEARGLLEGRVDLLERAVELLSASSRPLALASAVEDLADQHQRDGSRAQSVDALERALQIYNDCGAHRDARRVRARLRDHGIRRRPSRASARPTSGWAAMTDSELAVARLVAQGLTNREVAERLFVSPHTINSHLRQIFSKLQVSSRVALSRMASSEETAAEQG